MMAGVRNGDAIKLVSRSLGDVSKPCLLMISGKSSTMNMWRGLPEKIAAAGFHVIIFDNRDMGQSQRFLIQEPSAELVKHREGRPYAFPYTLDDLADDSAQVLDHYRISKAHILGASMGGSVAQVFATKFNSRALSLTTIMSSLDINHWAAKGFETNTDFFMKILAAPPTTPQMSLEEFLENRLSVWSVLLTDAAHPQLSIEERDLFLSEMRADFERGAIDHGDVGGMNQMLATNAWIQNSLAAHRSALSALSIPALILHGRHDKLFPKEAALELASVIPNAKLDFYDGGHNLPLDQHPKLVEMIVSHIS